MKIRLFQSDKGDCLLLKSTLGTILVDGGMANAYSEHVAEELAKEKALDLVYVSHIDQDHISGVLRMLDDAFEWRVYDHSKKNGGKKKPPTVPRPPKVARIWHNAFDDHFTAADGNLGHELSGTLRTLASFNTGAGLMPEEGEAPRTADPSAIVQSVSEALRVNYRLSPGQLNIPLNQGDGLLTLEKALSGIKFGDFNVRIIGPAKAELDRLRIEWDAWLKKSKKAVKELRDQAREDGKELTNDYERFSRYLSLAQEIFGDRTKVTTPNLASLMLLAEAKGKRILLSGDGHADDILSGLESLALLKAGGKIHVDVLKVPHHASEHNTTREFVQRVSADHYIFCGNGKHENPDLGIVKLYLDSRLSAQSDSFNAEAPKVPFKFWFSCASAAIAAGQKHGAHMKSVENIMKQRATAAGSKLKYEFLKDDFLDISV